MSDIKMCRLVTGETIVGKRVEDVIEDCLLLQAMPVEGNQVRMGISPYWAPYSKEKANINIDSVMLEEIADSELAAQYQQITSGIVSATPGDLTAMKGAMGGPGMSPMGPGGHGANPGGALNLVK